MERQSAAGQTAGQTEERQAAGQAAFLGMVRRHIYFSGRVQGVGFRYHSYYIASGLGLTGWVRNLWDGRVEMEVQGRSEVIDEMVDRLRQQRYIEIEEMETRTVPCVRESGFEMAD